MFFVRRLRISDSKMAAIDSPDPTQVSKEYVHLGGRSDEGDLDPANDRLLCACDAGILFAIDAASGRVLGDVPLSGVPDVIFLNVKSRRLYVAIGDMSRRN